MLFPPYVEDLNIYYSDVTTPGVLIFGGATQIIVAYETLITARDQEDMDKLVEANGGTMPLTSMDVAMNLILENGSSWYETYRGTMLSVTPAKLPTYSTFAGTCCGGDGGGGGGGGDYTLPVATKTRLGGIKQGDAMSIAADGTLTVFHDGGTY